jgi:hypothetical protein
MTANVCGSEEQSQPTFPEMIAEWRRLNSEAAMFDKAGQADESEAASGLALDVLHAIADRPAASADEILLKLALAHEAYVGDADYEMFMKTTDPIADYVWQSLVDARRIVGGAS